MLKRKKKLSANKKTVITMTALLSFVLVAVITSAVIIFANSIQNVTTSIAISYTSVQVDGEMKLTAYYGDTQRILTRRQVNTFEFVDYITFNAGSTEDLNYNKNSYTSSLDLDDVSLTTSSPYIVFECAFKNLGSHAVKLTFSDSPDQTELQGNYTKTQRISRTKLTSAEFEHIDDPSTSYTALTVAGVGDGNYIDDYVYYYVKVRVSNLGLNAAYDTEHSWIFTGNDQVSQVTLNNVNGEGELTNKTTPITIRKSKSTIPTVFCK